MSAFIAIAPGLGWSLVLCPRSFRIGFVPLSEAFLCALQLPARFLVVLHAAASLCVFWPLSWVLPFQGSAPVPQFAYPSKSLTHSIPRSFLLES